MTTPESSESQVKNAINSASDGDDFCKIIGDILAEIPTSREAIALSDDFLGSSGEINDVFGSEVLQTANEKVIALLRQMLES